MFPSTLASIFGYICPKTGPPRDSPVTLILTRDSLRETKMGSRRPATCQGGDHGPPSVDKAECSLADCWKLADQIGASWPGGVAVGGTLALEDRAEDIDPNSLIYTF